MRKNFLQKYFFFTVALCMIVSPFIASAENAGSLGSEKLDWFRCRQKDECIVIRGVCDWACVSRSAQKEAREYYIQKSATAECRNLGFDYPAPKAVCGFSVCRCQANRK